MLNEEYAFDVMRSWWETSRDSVRIADQHLKRIFDAKAFDEKVNFIRTKLFSKYKIEKRFFSLEDM